MDTPKIVLRFSDPGDVRTIWEHQRQLNEAGAVIWGWWPKKFEDRAAAKEKVKELGPAVKAIYLCDSTDKSSLTWYLAAVQDVQFTVPGAERKLIPLYYRDRSDELELAFKLSSIIPTHRLEGFEDKIGTPTIYFADNRGIITSDSQWYFDHSRGRGDCLLHISDLHVGADHGFLHVGSRYDEVREGKRDSIVQALEADLNALKLKGRIAGIILSGDFVSRGAWDEDIHGRPAELVVRETVGQLKQITCGKEGIVAVVPGNHDIIRDSAERSKGKPGLLFDYGHEQRFREFREEVTSIYRLSPLNYVQRIATPQIDVCIGMLNSAYINNETNFIEYGFVGGEAERIFMKLNELRLSGSVPIVACHHHLLPTVVQEPIGSNDRVSLTLDAGRLLSLGVKHGVAAMFHGHEHEYGAFRYSGANFSDEPNCNLSKSVIVVSGGSVGAKRERRRDGVFNSYNVLEFTSTSIELRTRAIFSDGRDGHDVCKVQIGDSSLSEDDGECFDDVLDSRWECAGMVGRGCLGSSGRRAAS